MRLVVAIDPVEDLAAEDLLVRQAVELQGVVVPDDEPGPRAVEEFIGAVRENAGDVAGRQLQSWWDKHREEGPR